MGNCLSKRPLLFAFDSFRSRGRKGLTCFNGETKARSLGLCMVNKKNILTPVSDRFSLQACDLNTVIFRGLATNHKLSQAYLS